MPPFIPEPRALLFRNAYLSRVIPFFIAILLLFGIGLILLEILIVPGLIVGIAGAFFMFLGIFWTYSIYGQMAAVYVGIGGVLLLLLVLYLALKTGFWKRFSLKEKLSGRVNTLPENTIQAGDTGFALSSLRPMGTVRVGQQKFNASTEGEMIPANYPVIITRIEADRLIVRPRNDSEI